MLRVDEHSLSGATKPSGIRRPKLLSGHVVLLALYGGERRWLILLIEPGLDALLDIIAASAAAYFDPSLRDTGRRLLILGGAAGLSGALGTRLLDLVVAGLQRRIG